MDLWTQLRDLYWQPWTLVMVGGIFAFLRVFNGIDWSPLRPLYEHLFARRPALGWLLLELWRRILPVMPEVLGAAVCAVGWVPAVVDQPLPLRVAYGLTMGLVASKGPKVLSQSILGDDAVIQRARRARRGGSDE